MGKLREMWPSCDPRKVLSIVPASICLLTGAIFIHQTIARLGITFGTAQHFPCLFLATEQGGGQFLDIVRHHKIKPREIHLARLVA